MKMFCPSCGKSIEESDAFCRSCGKNLKSQTQPVQPKPEAPVTPSGSTNRDMAVVTVIAIVLVLGLIAVGGYQYEQQYGQHGASVNDKELSISKINLVNIGIDSYVSYSSGYPPSLSVMREPPLLPGMKRKHEPATAEASGGLGFCEGLAETGMCDGWRFTYVPGPRDKEGRINTYTLHVDPLPERLKRDGEEHNHYLTNEKHVIYVEPDHEATDDSEVVLQ